MEPLWRLHPEPTCASTATRRASGRRARAMDRALPLLQPGRSFRFAFLEGGKDPDDILREPWAGGAEGQLADDQPFVEALFDARAGRRAAGARPSSGAGLKVRLRAAAAVHRRPPNSRPAYREALLDGRSCAALFAAPRPAARAAAMARRVVGPRKARWPPPQTARPVPVAEGCGRALRRRRSIRWPRPWRGRGRRAPRLHRRASGGPGGAGVLRRPGAGSRLRPNGHGCALQAEHLDSQGLRRHLRAVGLAPCERRRSGRRASPARPSCEMTSRQTAPSLSGRSLRRWSGYPRWKTRSPTWRIERDATPTLHRLKTERDALSARSGREPFGPTRTPRRTTALETARPALCFSSELNRR